MLCLNEHGCAVANCTFALETTGVETCPISSAVEALPEGTWARVAHSNWNEWSRMRNCWSQSSSARRAVHKDWRRFAHSNSMTAYDVIQDAAEFWRGVWLDASCAMCCEGRMMNWSIERLSSGGSVAQRPGREGAVRCLVTNGPWAKLATYRKELATWHRRGFRSDRRCWAVEPSLVHP